MFCTKKITDDLTWVGGNDRRLALFEGVYSVPDGISYNSYILKDEKNVLFDTVDAAVSKIFYENVSHTLDGAELDYIIIHHVEPDHSASLEGILYQYPNAKIICNAKIAAMLNQFFTIDISEKTIIVKEGDSISTGKHNLNFIMAPMVHWPEVMMTYDSTSKTLFSADAFGCFGALNGAIFADEVDFERDYMDEARRYYTNIVGKYGIQVQSVLKKASGLDIAMICPLHGFVWRNNLNIFIEKYSLWSSYTPEENGVMIAYASVYGNTANTAEILSSRLRDIGIKTVMFDVSVTPAANIVAAAFKWSSLVFASPTYNAGVFVTMEALLHDIAAHNIQNRTIGFIENGSWAATSGKLMKEILSPIKNTKFIENKISIKSAVKASESTEIDAFVDALSAEINK